MARRSQRPSNAELITTYEQLRFFAGKFAEGAYNCLIFIGPPGRMKSTILEAETEGKAHLISGNATPFEAFCESQEHIDINLLIDDANHLYAEPPGQRLLKQLTNPRIPKTVSWTSNAPVTRGLLKTFTTTSKVCIIDNAWDAANEHILALEDRGRLLLFNPPPRELHEEIKRQAWFTDDEIYDFIGQMLWALTELSARLYVKADEAKKAGEDWRAFILKRVLKPHDMALVLLEIDPNWKDKSVEERCREWMRRTNMSRATYFNRKEALMGQMEGHRSDLWAKWAQFG